MHRIPTHYSALALLLIAISNPCHALVLTSPLLRIVDNFPAGITPKKIAQMIRIRNQIKNILYGTHKADTEPKGLYIFEGKSYCVAELHEIEEQLARAYEANAISDHDHHHKKQELAQCLALAKQDFDTEASQFMEQGRKIRETTMIFIKESCTRRERPDSFLLTWGDAEEGKEMESFHKHITSFADLSQFCIDLVRFLEDMIESCPHATAEFKKLVEAERQKQTSHESI